MLSTFPSSATADCFFPSLVWLEFETVSAIALLSSPGKYRMLDSPPFTLHIFHCLPTTSSCFRPFSLAPAENGVAKNKPQGAATREQDEMVVALLGFALQEG